MNDKTRDIAGVLAPPPVLFLAAFAIGLGAGYVWPAPFIASPIGYPIAAALGAAGSGLLVASAWGFRRARTPLEPWHPTTALVIDGAYRYSRNPIYLAATMIYIAIAIAADNAWLLAALAPALVALQFGVIAREERYLERKFGEDYRRYKFQVRRWL